MIWKNLIAVISIVVGSPGAFAGEKSMQMDTQEMRMKTFQKKLDFDRAVLNHVPSETIIFDWKNVGIPDHLDGWKLGGQDYFTLEGRRPRAMWEWAYRANCKTIFLNCPASRER
ncbi:MAG: hypothetical protein WKG03_22670, partial [Telluria sp.]